MYYVLWAASVAVRGGRAGIRGATVWLSLLPGCLPLAWILNVFLVAVS